VTLRRGLHADGHHAPLSYHGQLLLDPHRMDAYERAIRALVRPGDVVLDVGTGTGVLAMLAARRGARVHAVESMPVAELARALVLHNRLEDRVIVHRADLRAMAPVEPVDLVLGDFLGAYLVDDFMLPAVAAAGRWLKEGGRWSPSRVRLSLAPADVGVRELDVWRAPFYGVDLSPAHASALGECHRIDVGPAVLLAGGVAWNDFVPPGPMPRAGACAFEATRAGRLRGFVGWFEAELAPGVTLTTAPGVQTHWGQYLFPVGDVEVAAGDRIEVALALEESDGDLGWRWSGTVRRGGEVRAIFVHADDERWLRDA
jgi:SAM-dependent methyltransferase